MNRTANSTRHATLKIADVCCDVSMDDLHLTVLAGEHSPFPRVFRILNRTAEIVATLGQIRAYATREGFDQVRVVVEPTGVYHELLLNLASQMGMLTALVNGEHVAKMRVVIFGDSGKTDKRDPAAIAGVVRSGRLIIDRRRNLPEVFELLHEWGTIYQRAEDGVIESKARVHRAMKLLFPDFDFKTDFLFGPTGQAIMTCYGFDPYQIARHTPARILTRLRRHSSVLERSVVRLLASARASVLSTPDGERRVFHRAQLAQAWQDWQLHQARRTDARDRLEALYDEARSLDPRLPAPVHGVVSKPMLARLFAELGPIRDFNHWRQVLRYAGMNLRERQSGTYVGMIKIARKGRPQLRRILNQIALPLVRRRCLFGAYFHHKRKVQNMPGPKAMMAVSRKLVKMFWGWIQSGQAFDPQRVFTCKGDLARAVA